MKRIPAPVWFAGIPAALVVAAGMTLSYNALAVLALSAGIDPVLSWAYPGVIDGVIITGSVTAYVLRRARLRIRLYLWTLIGIAVGLSIVGNATHALTHGGLVTLPPLAAAAVSAVPPASLAAALHVIVVLWRALGGTHLDVSDARPDAMPDGRDPALIAAPKTGLLAAHEETPNGRRAARPKVTLFAPARRAGRGDSRRRVARLLRSRPDATAAETAKRLGLSRAQAGRLLAAARKERSEHPAAAGDAALERKTHVVAEEVSAT